MKLYEGPSKAFIWEGLHGTIASKLALSYYKAFQEQPSKGEYQSWENSLRELAKVFDKLGLYDHGILLEYQMPLASKRLDCLIAGKNSRHEDNAVIIELKQWSDCSEIDGDGEVFTRFADGYKEVLHPSVQVGQYVSYLNDVNTAFTQEDPVTLSACAYLHNYHIKPHDALTDSKFDHILEKYPAYTIDREQDFEKFLTSRLSEGQGLPIADRIARSPAHVSKKLMDHVGNMIKGNKDYILLDEQKLVYDKIMSKVRHALQSGQKYCILVRGGPGTGKSVIALNLLADLSLKNIETHYATGSRAFTSTLRAKVGAAYARQFKYFNNYMWAQPNQVPVIICDEAHRIRKSSNNRFQPRTSREQIDELLSAGLVTVFFIDDRQVVRPGEIGSAAYIEQHAENMECRVARYILRTEFRCLGSDSFVKWIDNVLDIKKTANAIWDSHEESFDFRIMDTPQEVEDLLKEKVQEGYTARMVAGFCWDWTVPLDPDGNLHKDVVIGSYRRPWNANPRLSASVLKSKGIPSSDLWASDPHGFSQIGCIYSAQGFEFDYAGVIVGKDMVYDISSQQWIGHPENTKDRTVGRAGESFLQMIKNTYRVLFTRGMKGCYVYFLDEDTRKYVESRLK